MINALIKKAYGINLLDKADEIYVRNRIMALTGTGYADCGDGESPGDPALSIPQILEMIAENAVKGGVIGDFADERDILTDKIMDCFMGRPSEINRLFNEKYRVRPADATDYFYRLCMDADYIKTMRIARNVSYKQPTEFGEIDITINLSKPEKDPKDIEREKYRKDLGYPKCQLCAENEGYEGHPGHPSRVNLRLIGIELNGEPWYFQYSPYSYYREHCIVLTPEHTDMKIERATFKRLADFTDMFPHYFLGSNADLPIVGGSILNHNHFQGGNYEFPMEKAPAYDGFTLKGYESVRFSLVKWPMTLIRLESADKDGIIAAAGRVFERWRSYDDPERGVLSRTGDEPHNTVTAIARKKGDTYTLSIVLRNNRRTQEYPLGVFHPHADVHHIKKENIGLIEVMGLAILPGRLLSELEEVKRFVAGESDTVKDIHRAWALELKSAYARGGSARPGAPDINEPGIDGLIRREVAYKFLKCLHDAAVFKYDADGKAALRKFVSAL